MIYDLSVTRKYKLSLGLDSGLELGKLINRYKDVSLGARCPEIERFR